MYRHIVDFYRRKWERQPCIGWAACVAHYRELMPPAPELTAPQKERFLAKLDELWPAGRGLSKEAVMRVWKVAWAYALEDAETKRSEA